MKVTVGHQHKCECVAVAPYMGEGRNWWIGKLTEPLPDFPSETHCLHLETPVKDVTFLCNKADFQNLIIVAVSALGELPDIEWLKSGIRAAKNKKPPNL